MFNSHLVHLKKKVDLKQNTSCAKVKVLPIKKGVQPAWPLLEYKYNTLNLFFTLGVLV